MELATGIILGIALSAAVGFRIFVPFLVMSIATRMGLMDISSGFEWIASTPALVLLITATSFEVLAYFIPWFDNILDIIAAPLAVICGSIVMASAIVEIEPWIKWTMAIIAGGGTAGLIHGATTATRAASTVTTAGIGNPLVNIIEIGSSFVISILAVFLPFIAIIFVLVIVFFIAKRYFKKRKKQQAVLKES